MILIMKLQVHMVFPVEKMPRFLPLMGGTGRFNRYFHSTNEFSITIVFFCSFFVYLDRSRLKLILRGAHSAAGAGSMFFPRSGVTLRARTTTPSTIPAFFELAAKRVLSSRDKSPIFSRETR